MAKYNEKEILSNYLENIKNKLQACLFMLGENSILMKDKDNFEFSYPLPENLIEIEQKTFDTFKNLENILSSEINNRDAVINEVMAINKELIEISESIYCYFSFNDLLQEIIVHFQRMALIAKEEIVPIDIHSFYHDCLDFINKDKQDFLKRNNMSLIMKRLPLKMTKAKYEDYIQDSIKLLVKSGSESFADNIIRTFKFKFMPSKMDIYGTYYPEIKDVLDTIFAYDLENMSYDELKEAYTALDDNISVLQGISDYLSALHESINFLVLIITFSKDLNYLLEDDLIKKDIFYSLIENINDAESPFDENLYDLIDSACEQYVDKIIAFDKNKDFRVENLDLDNISDETLGVLKIHKIVTNGYYERLSDIVFPVSPDYENATPASSDYIEEKTAEFIGFIRNSLEDIKPSMSKILRRLFLDCIPSCFSEEEFQQYLNYILETTNEFAQKVSILDAVGAMFENTGYLNKIIEKEEGHHHHDHHHGHHHDHDCDCGHDHHHHDHDCDCGHDHHH